MKTLAACQFTLLTAYIDYQIPSIRCKSKLTAVMQVQQQRPIMRGLPPVLTSLTIFVFRPIALMARTMKNFDSSLTGAKTFGETPTDVAIVVISDAAIKYRIKKGKICFICTFF